MLNENAEYKKSDYTILFLAKDHSFAFSSATGCLALLDEATFRLLNNDSPFQLDDSEAEPLIKTGLIVSATNIDEPASYDKHINELIANQNKAAIHIAPTLSCCFACRGCLQGDKHIGSEMTLSVREALLAFILKMISTNNACEQLDVTWYGGEPTLALDVVFSLSEAIGEMCASRGILLKLSMVTNGYAIGSQPDLAKRLVDCGITKYQITLDGPPRVHNASRPLFNGKETFSEVLESIVKLYMLNADVKVRINIDGETWPHVPETLDLLAEKGLSGKLLVSAGFKHDGFSSCKADCNLMTLDDFAKAHLLFDEMLYQRGFCRAAKSHFPVPLANSCMANAPQSFAVDPDGFLYKCLGYVGFPTKSVGTVFDPDGIEDSMVSLENSARCRSCRARPICMGGCPELRSNGSAIGCIYRGDNLERMLQVHASWLQ